MECKWKSKDTEAGLYFELIDTLWNVNTFNSFPCSTPLFELIDTLWNVNITFIDSVGSVLSRINRYIMECKFTFSNG